MVRKLLFILVTLFTSPGQAQSWCAPGATWTYTFSNSWTIEGIARFTYAGDTTIDAQTCQLIHAHYEGYDYALAQPFAYEGDPVITKVSGALVSILTTSGFDTLYNFAAAPGDHWNVTMEDGSDGPAAVLISDTGSTNVDGVPLHFLTTGNDTIVERFGALQTFMLPWTAFTLDAAGGPLRCYADPDVNYTAPTLLFGCDSWLGVSTIASSDPVRAFPNPGTDHFSLSLPPGPHIITLFDAMGRRVHQQQISDERSTINTAHLPSDIYLVKVDDGLQPLRWVKE